MILKMRNILFFMLMDRDFDSQLVKHKEILFVDVKLFDHFICDLFLWDCLRSKE